MKRRVEVTMSVTRAMLLREGLKVEKKNVEESLHRRGGGTFLKEKTFFYKVAQNHARSLKN